MKELRILLIGGLTKDKFEKKVIELRELLLPKNIDPSITVVNCYEERDISTYEENHDLILSISAPNLQTKLPIINALALMYAWMDQESMVNEIVSIGS